MRTAPVFGCTMRRRLVRVVAGSLLAWTLATDATSAELGVKAGMSMATFGNNFAAIGNAKRRLGFIGGGFTAFRIVPSVAIQTEVLFSMKGARDVGGIDSGSQNPTVPRDYEWKFTYVEIPVVLRVSPPFDHVLRPDLIAGAAVAFNTGANFEDKAVGSEFSVRSGVRNVDVGLMLGIGAHIGRGPVRYLIEGRYTRGLLGIYANEFSGSYQTVNDVFSVLVGVSH